MVKNHSGNRNKISAVTYQLQNKDGTIVLFPSWLKHYTDDVKNDEERITLGFDLVNIEGYEKGIKDERKYVYFAKCRSN